MSTLRPDPFDVRRLPEPVETVTDREMRSRAAAVVRACASLGPSLDLTQLGPGRAERSATGTLGYLSSLQPTEPPKPTERERAIDKLPSEVRQLAERDASLSVPLLRTVAFVRQRSEALGGGKVAMSMSQTAKAVGISTGEVEQLLDEATRRGLVERISSFSSPLQPFYRPIFRA